MNAPLRCAVCLHDGEPAEERRIRSNVRRLRERTFYVWRCASCRSLHCEETKDLVSLYVDYPVRSDKLDYFLRVWYGNILRRLRKAGLKPQHSLLDYGCNRGLFLQFLREKGYANCSGYDPFVAEFASTEVIERQYDFVTSFDVVEHDPAPRDFIARVAARVKPGGCLCIGTPNADGIDLADPEAYLHALHAPYHLHLLSARMLGELCAAQGLAPDTFYARWYMDSWLPGTSARLICDLLRFAGNDIDAAYEPPRLGLFLRHPILIVDAFFGYFMGTPRADNMMLVAVRSAAAPSGLQSSLPPAAREAERSPS